MTASYIHPSTAVDQQNRLRSALSKSFQVAFIVTVTVGTLAGTGLVLWLLKALATSRYGIYFGA
jgi:ABC-type spermidine/putrescine transport system permease subunit II